MDPAHLEATYNHSLYLWRNGRITDQIAKARVYTLAQGKEQGELLLQAMHEETGKTGSIGLLDGSEYKSKTFASSLNSASLYDDAKYALTGDQAGRIFYWSVEDGKCIHVIQAYDAAHYIYDERETLLKPCSQKTLIGMLMFCNLIIQGSTHILAATRVISRG